METNIAHHTEYSLPTLKHGGGIIKCFLKFIYLEKISQKVAQ